MPSSACSRSLTSSFLPWIITVAPDFLPFCLLPQRFFWNANLIVSLPYIRFFISTTYKIKTDLLSTQLKDPYDLASATYLPHLLLHIPDTLAHWLINRLHAFTVPMVVTHCSLGEKALSFLLCTHSWGSGEPLCFSKKHSLLVCWLLWMCPWNTLGIFWWKKS